LSQPVLGRGISVGMRASTSTASMHRPKARRHAGKRIVGLLSGLEAGEGLLVIGPIFRQVRLQKPASAMLMVWGAWLPKRLLCTGWLSFSYFLPGGGALPRPGPEGCPVLLGQFGFGGLDARSMRMASLKNLSAKLQKPL